MSLEAVPIEQVRQYWDRRPCNIRHSPKPVGSREYFDEVEARKYFVEPHIPRFAEFEKWRGKKVLEIGCGIGTDTMNFARHCACVTAVDLSENSLAVARQRAEVFGLQDNIRFYHGSAEELHSVVPLEPFDLIYSFGVIHHTPHPERVIGELRHFARPGTTLKIMVYHRYAWKVFGVVLKKGKGEFWRAQEIVARNSEAQTGCPVTYTYSRRAAVELVERGGFQVTDMWVDHIFPYRVSEYTQYRYVKALPFRWLPSPAMRQLEKWLGWHLCLTSVKASEHVNLGG
jgi:2-polyprenyl-3-methyl-5-hydroxy-6-metoxy-1,4-benzoquinol methylase